MLTCETSKTKKVKFGFTFGGVMARDLNANFKIMFDGVFYLIPCEIVGDYIFVEIPKLTDITKSKIKVGQMIKCELEVRVGDTILTPYADRMQVCLLYTSPSPRDRS